MGYHWASTMGADYGYIAGTSSAEGGTEQTDCFVGEHPESTNVYIIQQINPATKQYDESKVLLCFANKDEAVAAYEGSYSDGKDRIGRVSSTDVGALKSWLSKNWKYNTEAGPDHSGQHAAP
jgi:hypothetical protein